MRMIIPGVPVLRMRRRTLAYLKGVKAALGFKPPQDIDTLQRTLSRMPPTRLARFLLIADLPETVVLFGGRSIERALQAAGKTVISANVEPLSIPDDAMLIWDGPSFDPAGYEIAARLRERFPGRVTTTFRLLSGATLFQAVGELVGYHATDEEKLVNILTGNAPESWRGVLQSVDDRFPIAGKRVIEFGPLDGAMTAILFQLGAAEVTAVEIRMANVIKMRIAEHLFGWQGRLRLLVEDMHMVDADAVGRFDLVVAHGVYYHSAAPFRLLRNIGTLADTVFLGGFCADPARPQAPLIELSHEGHVYRAQPFNDPLQNDGAGAHPVGYYFLPDDLVAFMERQGFSVEVLDLSETSPNKLAGRYLRVLCRRQPTPTLRV